MWLEIALVLFLVLVNAGLAGSELAFVTLRESQLHRLAEQSEKGRRLASLVSDPNRFLSTIQIGITLAGFLASATAAVSLAQPLVQVLGVLGNAAEPVAVFVVTLILSYVTLVAGELAPKRIAMQRAQGWAMFAVGPISLLSLVTRPLVWLLARSTEGIVRLAGLDPHITREEVTEEEIRDMLTSHESMPPEQRSIIEGALELDERRLWQVLVPRSEVVFLTAGQTTAEGRAKLIQAGVSRAPVIGESEDDVVGVVHLRALVDTTGRVGDYLRAALVLPDAVGVLQALGRMQAERAQMALVVDEFGSVAGIVTLEDLLEEIVGEIYDEYDRDTNAVVRRRNGELELPGSFPAHDLADLDIAIEPGRHATIAGVVLEEIGEIPAVGDTVTVQDWTITVLEVTDRAILRVKLFPAPSAEHGVPEPEVEDAAARPAAGPGSDGVLGRHPAQPGAPRTGPEPEPSNGSEPSR